MLPVFSLGDDLDMNKKKKTNLKKMLIFLLGSFMLLFCISAFQVVRIFSNLQEEEKEFAALSAWKSEAYTPENPADHTAAAGISGDGEGRMLEAYEALYQKNPDLAGWLRIDTTKVNYPVMFTPEDPEYYLHRSFDKETSVSGVPFIGEGSFADSTNIMIYGHNMKNGTMFATLLKYAQKEFWREHPVIQFDNLYEENMYEIIGAFYSKAYLQEESGVFKYYQYPDLSTPELFDEYYAQVKKASLYDTGIEAEFGEQLLTLSTCSYHVKDGRFVVVARKMRN